MLSLLLPDARVDAIELIDLHTLSQQGIISLIVDVDNTLSEHHQNTMLEEKLLWLQQAVDLGFSLTLLSNNHPERIVKMASLVPCVGIGFAAKPLSHHYRAIAKRTHAKKHEIAVIGDQLFTDIAGGKLRGYYSIYVSPMSSRDIFFSRFTRYLEGHIVAYFQRKGRLL